MIENLKDVDKELIPTLRKIHELAPSVATNDSFVKLTKHCIAALEKRIALTNSAKDDWSVVTELKCNCDDCKKVKLRDTCIRSQY